MEPVYFEDDESREAVWQSGPDQPQALTDFYAAIRYVGKNATVSREELGLPPLDTEPDTYAIVPLLCGWWGLLNLRTKTVVTKIHGPGAREDITERWNVKTAEWLAWRARQDDGEEGRAEALS